jgi:hypothetical protein
MIEEDITKLYDNKQDNILEVNDTFVLATALPLAHLCLRPTLLQIRHFL